MARSRGVFAGEITVTVLIPAHNEEASLPATLASLRLQQRVPDRVIVVADNCTDDTVGVAQRFGAEVFETQGNTHKKGGALNQVLARELPHMGDNDTVLVMDADTQLSPQFLATAVQRFTADRALIAVGGLFRGEAGHGVLGSSSAMSTSGTSARSNGARGACSCSPAPARCSDRSRCGRWRTPGARRSPAISARCTTRSPSPRTTS
ncbi:glycosyltransferase family 2 protein [Leucobacter chromiiresistens]|uniref:glycosyltransferase family 2 protein n=1 Tax=Leucobacter chromiiresistens TaxID=1079994 RepID=UPI0039C72CD2